MLQKNTNGKLVQKHTKHNASSIKHIRYRKKYSKSSQVFIKMKTSQNTLEVILGRH